jgi:hypothetical protein
MGKVSKNGSIPPESVAGLVENAVRRGEVKLSPLGRKLLTARRKIEKSGIPLLSREEADREKAERRGAA